MKIIPEYGNAAFIVPSSVTAFLNTADSTELAALLYALSTPSFSCKEGAKEIGVSEKSFRNAIDKWVARGVISKGSDSASAKTEKVTDLPADKKSEHSKRSSSLPSYTTAETARFLENNAGTAEIIDSCENIIGKIFTTAETNIIIGLLDHLSLSGDYILLLFAHAAKIDKKSVRYVEKMALSFVDRDITRYTELEAELAAVELTEDTLKFVRKLFGIGRRVFTEKERGMVHRWCVDFRFGNEIIERAYEITANSTGDASLSYANAILENWHNAGLTTIEEIDKFSEEFDKKKNTKYVKGGKAASSTPFDSSFDTDDFFEAALKRSYNDGGDN